jgi:hypothetical protein
MPGRTFIELLCQRLKMEVTWGTTASTPIVNKPESIQYPARMQVQTALGFA